MKYVAQTTQTFVSLKLHVTMRGMLLTSLCPPSRSTRPVTHSSTHNSVAEQSISRVAHSSFHWNHRLFIPRHCASSLRRLQFCLDSLMPFLSSSFVCLSSSSVEVTSHSTRTHSFHSPLSGIGPGEATTDVGDDSCSSFSKENLSFPLTVNKIDETRFHTIFNCH